MTGNPRYRYRAGRYSLLVSGIQGGSQLSTGAHMTLGYPSVLRLSGCSAVTHHEYSILVSFCDSAGLLTEEDLAVPVLVCEPARSLRSGPLRQGGPRWSRSSAAGLGIDIRFLKVKWRIAQCILNAKFSVRLRSTRWSICQACRGVRTSSCPH